MCAIRLHRSRRRRPNTRQPAHGQHIASGGLAPTGRLSCNRRLPRPRPRRRSPRDTEAERRRLCARSVSFLSTNDGAACRAPSHHTIGQERSASCEQERWGIPALAADVLGCRGLAGQSHPSHPACSRLPSLPSIFGRRQPSLVFLFPISWRFSVQVRTTTFRDMTTGEVIASRSNLW